MYRLNRIMRRQIRILEFLGWTVIIPDFDLSPQFEGQIDYINRTISVNQLSDKKTVIAFFHEIGHLIFYYLVFLKLKSPKKEVRELAAKVIGFIMARVSKSKISWSEWDEEH